MASDQFIFELHFQRQGSSIDDKENQFVIVDGTTMANLGRLKEDLGPCMPEPFSIQYIDDEEDVISIDTEEEFQEFAKITKHRFSRGMLMRLILNADSPTPLSEIKKQQDPKNDADNGPSEIIRSIYAKKNKSRLQLNGKEIKEKIKSELKKEILAELRLEGSGAPSNQAVNPNLYGGASSGWSRQMDIDSRDAESEEDDDLLLPKNTRITKLCHKTLDKKEKLLDSRIEQKLVKLEKKRKKLIQSYGQIKTVSIPRLIPYIYSVVATKESQMMTNPVTPGEMFTHVWTIYNDGTVALVNFELRHTWSSPGLEPEKSLFKLSTLMAGVNTQIVVRFKAPRIRRESLPGGWQQLLRNTRHDATARLLLADALQNNRMPLWLWGREVAEAEDVPITSYWQFFRKVDGHWQEFGHYVSLSGLIKSTKSTKRVKIFGNLEEPKPIEKSGTETSLGRQEEVKVQNQESNLTLQQQMKQLQATLASSAIAAEMSEKASKLLAMVAENNTKPSEGDKLNNCVSEEAASAVQQLNLVDSESDTDANMDTCDGADRGFVMVNMTSGQTSQDTGTCETKESNKTVPLTDINTKNAQPNLESLPFPRLDPNFNYPVFPPTVPRVPNHQVPSPPMFMPHSVIPPNMYNLPVFPPTQTTWSDGNHGVVFPPHMNYPPTYPRPVAHLPFQHPLIPVAVSRTPNLTTLEKPLLLGVQNGTHIPIVSKPSAAQTTLTPDNPARTVQELNPVTQEEQQQQQAQQQPQQAAQQQQATQQAESTAQADEQNKTSVPVQILPQALVDGAINVASSAYSTAMHALNNLRPREGEASVFDPVFENNMAKLAEMGFNNVERNSRLLKRFHNDIGQVIAVICSGGGNLDID